MLLSPTRRVLVVRVRFNITSLPFPVCRTRPVRDTRRRSRKTTCVRKRAVGRRRFYNNTSFIIIGRRRRGLYIRCPSRRRVSYACASRSVTAGTNGSDGRTDVDTCVWTRRDAAPGKSETETINHRRRSRALGVISGARGGEEGGGGRSVFGSGLFIRLVRIGGDCGLFFAACSLSRTRGAYWGRGERCSYTNSVVVVSRSTG